MTVWFPAVEFISHKKRLPLNRLHIHSPHICCKLPASFALTSLRESDNMSLDEKALMAHQAEIRQKILTLDQVNLSAWLRGEADVFCVVEALIESQTVRQLNLDNNRMSNESVRALAHALESNTQLQELSLDGTGIGLGGISALARALETNASLQRLNIGWNHVEADASRALFSTVRNNSTLMYLSLDGNRLGDDGILPLVETLQNDTSCALQRLDLCVTTLNTEGITALAQALRGNSTLQHLSLDENKAGAEGAHALAQMLETNTTLQTLTLARNNIGAQGAEALSQVLGGSNQTLQTLNLARNNIGAHGALALAGALRTNASIVSLDLNDNHCGDVGAAALAVALRINATLHTLNFMVTITPEGARALAEAMETNTHLLRLQTRRRGIRDPWSAVIQASTRRNQLLSHVREFFQTSHTLGEVIEKLAALLTFDEDLDMDGLASGSAVYEMVRNALLSHFSNLVGQD